MPGEAPGAYKIALNEDDTEVQNLAAFLHEMTHIFNHDFDREGESVDRIEKRTRRLLRQALELLQREEQEGRE